LTHIRYIIHLKVFTVHVPIIAPIGANRSQNLDLIDYICYSLEYETQTYLCNQRYSY